MKNEDINSCIYALIQLSMIGLRVVVLSYALLLHTILAHFLAHATLSEHVPLLEHTINYQHELQYETIYS